MNNRRFFIIGIQEEHGNDLELTDIEQVNELMSSDLREQVCDIEYGFTNQWGHRIVIDVGAVHCNWVNPVEFVLSDGTFEAAHLVEAMDWIINEFDDGLFYFMEDFDDETIYQMKNSDACIGDVNWNAFKKYFQ